MYCKPNQENQSKVAPLRRSTMIFGVTRNMYQLYTLIAILKIKIFHCHCHCIATNIQSVILIRTVLIELAGLIKACTLNLSDNTKTSTSVNMTSQYYIIMPTY